MLKAAICLFTLCVCLFVGLFTCVTEQCLWKLTEGDGSLGAGKYVTVGHGANIRAAFILCH